MSTISPYSGAQRIIQNSKSNSQVASVPLDEVLEAGFEGAAIRQTEMFPDRLNVIAQGDGKYKVHHDGTGTFAVGTILTSQSDPKRPGESVLVGP